MTTETQKIKEQVIVEFTADKMLAVISFGEPKNDGDLLTLDEIKNALHEKGVVYGIKEDELQDIQLNHRYNYKYIIAQGKKPTEGTDGRIEFAFDVENLKELKPKINEDGTVDLKDLSAVKNVKKGDVLAKKIPAVFGEDGCNVLGQPIRPQRVKEARIPKGKNTRVLEDNLTLVADIDGKLEYDDHNIYINSVYTVYGDLDSSVGNIDFVGSVVIQGSINSGYTIKAGGTVEVKGPVDDAVIIAGEDIVLSYGIQGTEKSKLVAKGNVIAKFIQNANVEADGCVITEAIMHSTVTAGDSIRVEMGKGTIVGGNVGATNLIVAKSIGSPMGSVTAVQIGVPPTLYTEHKQLGEQLKAKKAQLDQVDQSVAYLITKGQLDQEKRMMLQKLSATRLPIVEEYETLRARHERIGETLKGVRDGLIKCTGTMYPGVQITVGSLVRYLDDKENNVVVRKVDGEIHIGI